MGRFPRRLERRPDERESVAGAGSPKVRFPPIADAQTVRFRGVAFPRRFSRREAGFERRLSPPVYPRDTQGAGSTTACAAGSILFANPKASCRDV